MLIDTKRMKRPTEYILSSGVSIIFSSPITDSYKFGYYNLSPMSADGSKLLAHKIMFDDRLPNGEDVVEIGYFLISDGRWNKLGETSAFNWQQGSLLQWLGPDFNSKVIFNDADKKGGKYVSRILDVFRKEPRTIPHAIYGVHPSGDFSISINFERCNFTRAYGYESLRDERWNHPMPERDGILSVDLKTGNARTIIKLRDVVQFAPDPSFKDTAHWIEHIMLNPSGTRFAFYHRYQLGSGFGTRVFTSDIDGTNLWLHPNKTSERVTHLGWQSDLEYVLFTIAQSKLNLALTNGNRRTPLLLQLYRKWFKRFIPRRVVKRLPQANSFYALTRDMGGVTKTFNIQPAGMDGHPSFTRSGRYMLSDTYADKEGYRNLVIHDLENNKTKLLGRFFSIYNNCPWRTDLHPRFSPDERSVLIDTNHHGKCQILALGLNWNSIFNES